MHQNISYLAKRKLEQNYLVRKLKQDKRMCAALVDSWLVTSLTPPLVIISDELNKNKNKTPSKLVKCSYNTIWIPYERPDPRSRMGSVKQAFNSVQASWQCRFSLPGECRILFSSFFRLSIYFFFCIKARQWWIVETLAWLDFELSIAWIENTRSVLFTNSKQTSLHRVGGTRSIYVHVS